MSDSKFIEISSKGGTNSQKVQRAKYTPEKLSEIRSEAASSQWTPERRKRQSETMKERHAKRRAVDNSLA